VWTGVVAIGAGAEKECFVGGNKGVDDSSSEEKWKTPSLGVL
jgi:hypothetical protein